MEGDACDVCRVDPGDQHVEFGLLGLRDDRLHELPADPRGPESLGYVDGVLSRVFIGRPRPERPPGGEPREHPRLPFDANHRNPVPHADGQPLPHRLLAPRRVLIECSRVENRIVQDLLDHRQVGGGAADHGTAGRRILLAWHRWRAAVSGERRRAEAT